MLCTVRKKKWNLPAGGRSNSSPRAQVTGYHRLRVTWEISAGTTSLFNNILHRSELEIVGKLSEIK